MTTEDTRHFVSDCCGRGMCEECFDNLQGTTEQWQVDWIDDEDFEKIRWTKWQHASYLCFDCLDKILNPKVIIECPECGTGRQHDYPVDEQGNQYCPDCNSTF